MEHIHAVSRRHQHVLRVECGPIAKSLLGNNTGESDAFLLGPFRRSRCSREYSPGSALRSDPKSPGGRRASREWSTMNVARCAYSQKLLQMGHPMGSLGRIQVRGNRGGGRPHEGEFGAIKPPTAKASQLAGNSFAVTASSPAHCGAGASASGGNSRSRKNLRCMADPKLIRATVASMTWLAAVLPLSRAAGGASACRG